MAEHKIQGGDMLLFIDPTGGTNYDTVVCLTSVSVSDSVQPVDASSACGPDKSPGAVQISIAFEGQHLQDPNTGTISGSNLLLLLRAEQTIGWKLSPLNPVAGDEIQEGIGFISELSSTYSYDSIGIFSMTISPFGLPTTSIEPPPPPPIVLNIGQFYEGGNIAYLDGTGQHGFVVYDNGTSVAFDQWSTSFTLTGANAYSIGSGAANTALIIANSTSIPALACVNGNFNGFNDWVMPSAFEMYQIILEHNNGFFANLTASRYWSSSENNAPDVAFLYTVPGNNGFANNKTELCDVVAIRYF